MSTSSPIASAAPVLVQDLPVILHNDHRGLLTIEDGRLDVLQLSKDGRPPKRLLSCRMRHFLRARLSPSAHKGSDKRRLDLHTLLAQSKDKDARQLRLSKMHVLVEPTHMDEAEKWVETAMRAAYPTGQDVRGAGAAGAGTGAGAGADDEAAAGGAWVGRRVLLLVNPVGGKGKAKTTVRETVLPILEAAGCRVQVIETTHRLHAEEIAREVSVDDYDVIATASGDGSVYEVLNGLAARADARRALRMPLAPIPTGSANALCINLFGVADTFNIELACLNVIKGAPMPLDLISTLLLPSNERRVGFLSIALGLMVDLDLGTEHLRWMGDTRFVYGFVRGALANRRYACRLRLKVEESDKIEMVRVARETIKEKRVVGAQSDGLVSPGSGGGDAANGAKRAGGASTTSASAAAPEDVVAVVHPPTGDGPLDFGKKHEPDGTWLTIESGTKNAGVRPQPHTENAQPAPLGGWQDGDGVLYMYAGMMPWVSRDLMQWPVATAGQGVIDVVVQSIVPRATLIGAITGAEKGESYWMDCQHYYKCSAMVVENLDKAKQEQFTIDGEGFSFDSFHVEILPKAASVMSLDGHFYISDFLKQNKKG